MQKMLDENTAAAKAILAGAENERTAAATALAEARRQLQETERNAPQILQDYTAAYSARLEKDLLKEVKKEVAVQLLSQGKTIPVVARVLNVEEDFVRDLAKRERPRMPMLPNSWLEYEDDGRSGYVILHYGSIEHRFFYEFAGGTTLVTISIPVAAYWEKHTGLPLERREIILHFIGDQVVHDKAPGYLYRIEDQFIVIYLE